MVMIYRVEIEKPAAKVLAKIATRDRVRITQRIYALAVDPRPAGCVNLQDCDGYRIRVGNYRVIYEVGDSIHIVAVTTIGHRREVYEK